LEQLGAAEDVDALALLEPEVERVELPARHLYRERRAVLRVLEREEDRRPALLPAQLRDLALDPECRQLAQPARHAVVEATDGVDLAPLDLRRLDLHEADASAGARGGSPRRSRRCTLPAPARPRGAGRLPSGPLSPPDAADNPLRSARGDARIRPFRARTGCCRWSGAWCAPFRLGTDEPCLRKLVTKQISYARAASSSTCSESSWSRASSTARSASASLAISCRRSRRLDSTLWARSSSDCSASSRWCSSAERRRGGPSLPP